MDAHAAQRRQVVLEVLNEDAREVFGAVFIGHLLGQVPEVTREAAMGGAAISGMKCR